MSDMSRQIDEYISNLKSCLDKLSRKEIQNFLCELMEARESGKQIFIMGNGGSAATASHFVCDFNKGVNENNNKRFKFICLNDNVPSMMAYGNDISYDSIFVEQLKNYLNEGDVVIGISGSGNSVNVVNAISYANAHGAKTIGLVGYNGGKLGKICQLRVHVNINNMQIVEDIHMILDHMGMTIINSQ